MRAWVVVAVYCACSDQDAPADDGKLGPGESCPIGSTECRDGYWCGPVWNERYVYKCQELSPNGYNCDVGGHHCASGWCNPTTHRCDDSGDTSCDVDEDCPPEHDCKSGMCVKWTFPPS
jgi:hypothetical protein